jgi:hypothetical protein
MSLQEAFGFKEKLRRKFDKASITTEFKYYAQNTGRYKDVTTAKKKTNTGAKMWNDCRILYVLCTC